MLSRCNKLVNKSFIQHTSSYLRIEKFSPVVTRNFHYGCKQNKTLINKSAYVIQCRFQSTLDAIDIPAAPIASSIHAPASILENIPEAPFLSSSAASSLLENIPDAPIIPAVEPVIELAEPAFATLGLGGWTPVGLVQNCMEYLHIGLDIPWWGSVLIGTVVVRTMIFPLVILAQRNAAKMNNYMPQIQLLQMKMTEARQTGNAIESARYGQEMVQFMRDKNLNPVKNMLVPLAQAPIFISFFVGLRGMANAPVESMRYGGLFWFNDLTVPDQFYALPIITSLTMWLTIEIGTDSARLSSQNLQTMKYVLRALPVLILPFTVNFPGAILLYWTLSNFISLAQVGFLRLPKVRKFFKIDKLVHHNPNALPMKKKGFKEGLTESWTNMKISRELEERKRIDEIQFNRAGKGPVVKTFKYDPTKLQKVDDVISAKKR